MRYLIVRYGAYGDCIFLTPVLKYLKDNGNEVILNISNRGRTILEHFPYVDKIVYYEDNSLSPQKLEEYWKKLEEDYKPDRFVNFSEHLEVEILFHPFDPKYNLPKNERIKRSNVNFFDHHYKVLGFNPQDIPPEYKKPILEFTAEEVENMGRFFKQFEGVSFHIEPRRKFVILWVLSGSAVNFSFKRRDKVKIRS